MAGKGIWAREWLAREWDWAKEWLAKEWLAKELKAKELKAKELKAKEWKAMESGERNIALCRTQSQVPEIPLPEFPCLNVLTRAMEGKGIWAKEYCTLSFYIPVPEIPLPEFPCQDIF